MATLELFKRFNYLEKNQSLFELAMELFKRFNYSEKDLSLFELAIKHAEALKTVPRKSGDTFFGHNLRVASILAENKAAPEVIVASLIQGLNLDDKTIAVLFGSETAALMLQVDELRKLTFKNKQLQAEAFRKMLLTTLTDVRAVLVKLAAKIDNFRTIAVFPIDEQQRLAREVMEIYGPLAYRLGLDRIKSQLEDLAFQIINPKKYREIFDFLKQSKEQRDQEIKKIITEINAFSSEKVQII